MADTFAASCFVTTGPGSRPCTVAVEPRWLVIRPEAAQPVRWPYEALICDVAGDERAWLALSCPRPLDAGVTTLVIREPGAVARVAARVDEPCRGVLEGFAAGARGHAAWQRRTVALAVLGLAMAVVAGWWSCTRLAPELVAETMPVATEMQLGRLLAEGFLAGERRVDDGPAREAVERIVARLAAAADNRGYTFTLHVVDDPRVNALALPGGQIVVFTGLITEAGSADEVAGVLAHEMQHVLHRHGLRQLVRRLGGAAVITLATGGGDLAGLAGRADELVQLSYGREQESEADRDGLALMHRAGLPPAAMASFFERLQRQPPDDVPEFLSTHPDTARRIEDLRRSAASLPPTTPEPLDIDWDLVRRSLE
jgi:Zn-dependent protease with chaperone function